MADLGVNIDHVATVRQARKTYEPDPVWAAVAAQLGGADGITLHLREGHKWSDGAPFTSEDIRYWWEDIVGEKQLGGSQAHPVGAAGDDDRPIGQPQVHTFSFMASRTRRRRRASDRSRTMRRRKEETTRRRSRHRAAAPG